MNEYIKIKGKQIVEGAISVGGSKNASLALICASLLVKGKVKLHHIPRIDDVFIMLDILKYLGCDVDLHEDILDIDSSNMSYKPLLGDDVRKIRASYYLIGVLLGTNKKVEIGFPGGCNFSSRPIDIHLDAFASLGASCLIDDHLTFTYEKLHQNHFELRRKSLGASINALLLMCQIEGEGRIDNVTREPELDDVIEFINQAGGYARRVDDTLIVKGRKSYLPISFFVSPDRIEIGSYAILGAALGRVLIGEVDYRQNIYLFELMDKLKIKYSYDHNLLCVEKSVVNYSGTIICDDFPAFPTDLKSCLSSLLLLNQGECFVEDKIYPKRIQYVKELQKLGGEINVKDDIVCVKRSPFLNGTFIHSCDLRASFGLFLASLISKGETKLQNFELIHRGYENIYTKLRQLNIDCEVNFN